MNPQQLKRIVVVLAVVVVFWILAEILGGSHDDSETALVLPALQMSEVNAIMITRPSGESPRYTPPSLSGRIAATRDSSPVACQNSGSRSGAT